MTNTTPLIELINQRLESGEAELPVFDNVALKIHKEAREGRLDADGLCNILEKDPALVSEVLRMSNSSFFSGLSEVRNLRDAVVRLGVKQIASITMSSAQKRLYSESKGPFRVKLLQLWQHASAVSLASRWLANQMGYRAQADDVFVAGMLHDVGKLSLLRIIEDIVKTETVPLTNDIVNMALAQLHPAHGVKLLEKWNLPELFRQVVQAVDAPAFDDGNITLCIVRLADRACALEGISDHPDPSIMLETLPEAQALGVSEIDVAELRILLEDFKLEKLAA